MFNKKIEYIFEKNKIKKVFNEKYFENDYVKNNFDEKINKIFEKLVSENYISKEINENQKSNIEDEVIKTILVNFLNEVYKDILSPKIFWSDNRKNKLKLINITANCIQKDNFWVLKSSIKDFYKRINSTRLLQILSKKIQDKRVIKLISSFLENQGFEKNIKQGDLLFIILKNIYWNLMDQFLVKKNINFIRYVDEFVIFFDNKKDAEDCRESLTRFLFLVGLDLDKDKTYISSIEEDGFELIGVKFLKEISYIDEEKNKEFIKEFDLLSKEEVSYGKYVILLNEKLLKIAEFYFQFIKVNKKEFEFFKKYFIKLIAFRIHLVKKNIIEKEKFNIMLEDISFEVLFNQEGANSEVNVVKNLIYLKYLEFKKDIISLDKKKNDKEIKDNKQNYLSYERDKKNLFCEIILEKPKTLKYSELLKELISIKNKNQISYLKFLSKKDVNAKKSIKKIKIICKNSIKDNSNVKEFIKNDKKISAIYWDVISEKLKNKTLPYVNNIESIAFDYAYDLLSDKIQTYLVANKIKLDLVFFDIRIDKTTFAFDLAEQFGVCIVDVSMLKIFKKSKRIKLNSKMILTKKSKKIILKMIEKRLNKKIIYKNEEIKYKDLIKKQCKTLFEE